MTRPAPSPGDRMSRIRRSAPLLAVALMAFLAGCASDAPQDTLAPEGPWAQEIADLINPIFAIAGLVFVVVLGGALVISLKFRARDDEHFDDMPSQIHGNNALEIGWTILPAVVLGAVGVFSVAAIFSLNEEPPPENLRVQVVGQQWWWEYRYDIDNNGSFDDPGDIVTANDLVIPVGMDVALDITSRDVIHSFWVPKLNGKRDAVPNRHHPWKIQADEPGEWLGQCTEYCGLSHAEMRIKTIALEQAEFDEWVANQERDATLYDESDETEAAVGQRTFTGLLCASCHLVEGVNDENFSDEDLAEFEQPVIGGHGTIIDPELQVSRHAPNLTHLMSRTTFAGAKFNLRDDTEYCTELGVTWADTEEDLARCLDRGALEAWLRNPPAEKAMYAGEIPGPSPRGMPNLELTEEQIDQLIAYLVTLK